MASSHHSLFTSEFPHFFKIILQESIRDGKLGIPEAFIKKYGNSMSSSVFLRVPSGEIWKVELERGNGRVWLRHGWQEFSNHYCLKHGHFVVFKYEGHCKFNVIIFDMSASEIEYPYTGNNRRYKDLPEPKMEDSEYEDSTQILDDIPASRKRKEMMRSTSSASKTAINLKAEPLDPQLWTNGCPVRTSDENTRSRHKIRKLSAHKKAEALQRAGDFKSENPFFKVVMQPTYVRKANLPLPTNFARKYMLKGDYDVILCNSNGKSWTVSYLGKRRYAGLFNGWSTFVKDNNLQAGDVCVFELKICIEIAFQVVIYHGQNANSHQSSPPDDVFHPVRPVNGFGRSLNRFERTKALQMASYVKSESPSFSIVMQPSYIYFGQANLPEKFAGKYFRKTIKGFLLLSNGKSWPVKYYHCSPVKLCPKLCGGWRDFVLDNNIKVGDVCVFELIESTESSLKVTISRKQAVDDANSSAVSDDKSGVNQVKYKECLVIDVESDSENDKGDEDILHNQHPNEKILVLKVEEENDGCSGRNLR